MPNRTSLADVEAALRFVNVANQSASPEMCIEATDRVRVALIGVIGDVDLWSALAKPVPGHEVADPELAADIKHLLSDELTSVMVRTGYKEPPPAGDVIRTARELVGSY